MIGCCTPRRGLIRGGGQRRRSTGSFDPPFSPGLRGCRPVRKVPDDEDRPVEGRRLGHPDKDRQERARRVVYRGGDAVETAVQFRLPAFLQGCYRGVILHIHLTSDCSAGGGVLDARPATRDVVGRVFCSLWLVLGARDCYHVVHSGDY
ncbi:hypothetical protein R6Q57_030106 [Mikania cordata]